MRFRTDMNAATLLRMLSNTPLIDQSNNHRSLAGAGRWFAQRCGFTLLEVLVVIGITGVLVAMLLPAVLNSRETARRAQCLNNIKQIGLALQVYHDAMRVLPPTSVWRDRGEPLGDNIASVGIVDRVAYGIAPGTEPARLYGNWAVMLLSSLEQQNLTDFYDSEQPISADGNSRIRESVVPVFVCPSDPNSGELYYERLSVIGQAGNRYARGNYAVNAGPNRRCITGETDLDTGKACEDGFSVKGATPETSSQVIGSGIAGVNVSLTFAAFNGVGLSNMVAVDELRSGEYSADPRGTWAIGFVGASITASHGIYSEGGRPNSRQPESDQIVGCRTLRQTVGLEGLARSGMPCTSAVIPNGLEVSVQATARSLHPGGVHVGMLDGAVQFVSESMDQQIWHDIHSRHHRKTN